VVPLREVDRATWHGAGLKMPERRELGITRGLRKCARAMASAVSGNVSAHEGVGF
jgi:hypothetical protein